MLRTLAFLGCAVALPLCLAAVPPSVSAQVALQAPPKSSAMPPPLPALPHPTLDRIHAANAMTCGISKEEEDYSRSEDHGNRAAFDIDLCKAVAIATLGTGAKLVVKSYPDEPFALRALRSGEVDVVATASLSVANMTQGVAFSAPVLLDGQSMLLPNNSAVHTAADLRGKKICFLTGSAAEDGLHSYAETHGISYTWYPFSEAGEMEAAFFTGNCDAISSDLTQLANIRAIDARRASEFTLLPGTFREDPLAVATWAGDASFSTLVYWTVQVLLQAEELGVTQANVETMRNSPKPEVQQLLGQRFGAAKLLGTRPQWGAEVLQAAGNYGELFERDLGARSALQIPRGNNRLAMQDGGLYALPVRDH